MRALLATTAILLAVHVTPGLTRPTEEPAERALAAALSPIHVPKEILQAASAAPPPPVARRPIHIFGSLIMAGRAYTFGSGGYRGTWSIPWGDHQVTPSTIGPWGKSHGAIGLANDEINDPQLHQTRAGIELHPIGPQLQTEGCVGVLAEQWPTFRRELLGMISSFGQAWLHVWPEGASVTPSPVAPPANLVQALFGDSPSFHPVVVTIVRRRHFAVNHHHPRHHIAEHRHHRRYARN